ncbi:MAG: hypothetical protein OZSIB_3377 [Candidatus Ozemobacter sibiricus]|jgi:hypothetical protein|uniref:Uncharacterized protein n=1 Tax=Candidatus Ozemobacter sibiricus TaxID=2268124 RepID=A0A367ZPX6_9BACT|nr:MAG: hypothetical protein OZSIB_3377 [Candidatus Ozemobacter sibiricus]
MSRHAFHAVVVLFLVALTIPLEGQPVTPGSFGYVNVAEALALHPLMARFDIKAGRFELAALGAKEARDRGALRQELVDRRNTLVKQREATVKSLDELDQAFQKDLGELSDLQARLNALPATARTPLLNEYNRKKGIIDRKYWQRRNELQEDLKLADHALAELDKETQVLHLTTMEETQKAFKLMLDDVYQAIDVVASHYQVPFVFNSSFAIDRVPGTPQFTPENPMKSYFAATLEGAAEDVLYKHGTDGRPPLFMTFRAWTGAQRWAFRTCYDPRLDKMFIKGGVNMTPAVVHHIYQKYKVAKLHSEVIQKYLEAEAKNY